MRTIDIAKIMDPSLRREEIVGLDSTHSYHCWWCGGGISWCKDYPRTRRADRFAEDHADSCGTIDDGVGFLVLVGALVERACRLARAERRARHTMHPEWCDGGACCGSPTHGCREVA